MGLNKRVAKEMREKRDSTQVENSSNGKPTLVPIQSIENSSNEKPILGTVQSIEIVNFEPEAFTKETNRKAFVSTQVEQAKQEEEVLKTIYTEKFDKALMVPVKELPSKYMIYPPNTSISYKRYNLQDLEDLNNSDLRLADKYNIMLSGIDCNTMDSVDLTFHDFNYISVLRRLEAQGATEFRHPYKCPECLGSSVHIFKLDELDFKPLDTELPVKVRFVSYPDEIFTFVPYTIGDILRLIENQRYYRAIGDRILRNNKGKEIVDTIALFACCCTSHTWTEAYEKLIIAGEHVYDRATIAQVDNILNHELMPIKFNCNISLTDKTPQRQEAENLVNKVVEGDLSVAIANSNSSAPIPAWLSNLNLLKNRCNAENFIDVDGRDIIIPFCESSISSEYGILS